MIVLSGLLIVKVTLTASWMITNATIEFVFFSDENFLLTMDNQMENSNISHFYEHDNGPPLHTRIAFASAWIFIAVAGIIGRKQRRIVSFGDLLFSSRE